MQFSLSTRWNAYRHASGEAMVEEILALGFDGIELGYDLRHELLPGVREMAARGEVRVGSVHNYCPIPMGAPMGHPELFTFGDPDERIRENAIWHTCRTIEFAGELGARVVVAHMGNVAMTSYSRKLIELAVEGRIHEPRYEKIKMKLIVKREKKAPRQLEWVTACLERVLPAAEKAGVTLAMENLPTWEAIPTEVEMEGLLRRFDTPHLAYWHDIGHAQIRENLGLIHHRRWLERLRPRLAGLHVHDVAPPAMDHTPPGTGCVDFASLRESVQGDLQRVFEPSRRVPVEDLCASLAFVRAAWAPTPADSTPTPTPLPGGTP